MEGNCEHHLLYRRKDNTHCPKEQPKISSSGWRKILYEKQNFPDNYTDPSFLEELRRNIYAQHVTLTQTVAGACRVTIQTSVVVLFGVIFVYLYENLMSVENLWKACFLSASLGYSVHYLLFRRRTAENQSVVLSDLRITIEFLVVGYATSPLLKTLTATISTDTIQAMAVAIFGIHLLFYDYGATCAIVSRPISLNAAMFASICLASRLCSTFQVFTFLSTAVVMFILLPLTKDKIIGQLPEVGVIALATPVQIVTALAVASLSTLLAALYVLLMLFVLVACPYWFCSWQTYKENIYGPWDEAIIMDNEAVKPKLRQPNPKA